MIQHNIMTLHTHHTVSFIRLSRFSRSSLGFFFFGPAGLLMHLFLLFPVLLLNSSSCLQVVVASGVTVTSGIAVSFSVFQVWSVSSLQAAVLPLIDGGSCFLSFGPQSLTRLVVPDAPFSLVRSFLSPRYKSSTDFTYYSGATKVSFDPVFWFVFL